MKYLGKKLHKLFAACVAVMLCLAFAAGCKQQPAAPEPTPTPTPVPVSAAELLADAMRFYEAGDYEEAILVYTGIIEIEPRNFDAHLGLGKSYRGAGKSDEAVTALVTAMGIDEASNEAAFELGCAYLDGGRYAEAQALSETLWNDGQGDVEAGIILLFSLAGQEKIDDMQALLANEEFSARVQGFTGEDSLYLGGYDEEGKRSGKGIGLYPDGYVYVGDYADGLRSGHGSWYYPDGSYYVGTWADDMPNGDGSIYLILGARYKGFFRGGLAEGEYYYQTAGPAQYRFNCDAGIPQSLGVASDSDGYGASGETIMAYMKQGEEDWSVAPHYWAGLRCAGCGEDIGDGSMPEWFREAFSHIWSGWRGNADVLGVQPWGYS